MTTIVIATRNALKAEEIQAIFTGDNQFVTLRDLPGAPVTDEDRATFAGNATKKAVELAKWMGGVNRRLQFSAGESVYVLADDSGLEVDALNGAPGVYSARFAGLDTGAEGNSSDADNNAKLLKLLKDVPMEKRTARFRCVLALTPVVTATAVNASPVCDADEVEMQTELFDGTCEGRIGFAAQGAGGFGYDPLFMPEGFKESFAELGGDTKNQMSHRAKALARLREWWKANGRRQ